jgi:hypothetical protein
MPGCQVLISDQTPWHSLEQRHPDWDLSLSQPERFAEVIARCVDMTGDELDVWSAGARQLGREIADDPLRDSAYREIFRAALHAGSPASLPTPG